MNGRTPGVEQAFRDPRTEGIKENHDSQSSIIIQKQSTVSFVMALVDVEIGICRRERLLRDTLD